MYLSINLSLNLCRSSGLRRPGLPGRIMIPGSSIYNPPALGCPEQTTASLRLIIAPWPCFVSDGRRSPRRVRISFHIMVTSLQRLWSVADVSADVRASLGSASCLSANLFDGTLVGGVRVSGGGGCDNVLSTTFLTFFVILQHPTRSWCYVMELVLATSHTNRVSWSSTRLQRPFHASPSTKIWASYVFCPSFPLNGKTFCCSCESCEKNHSQRKTPYLQAQKSQWSSEHKELRSASATSESCFQWVVGWCRIFCYLRKLLSMGRRLVQNLSWK